MSNPFLNWKPSDVQQHNERVAMKTAAQHNLEAGVNPPAVAPAASAAPRPNLILRPSADEQKLNKLERAWLHHLRALGYQPMIQALTFKLGDDCRYCPDFSALGPNGELRCWETKGGFFRDDAKVKLKVAARMYRWCVFVLVQKVNGQFVETEVNP